MRSCSHLCCDSGVSEKLLFILLTSHRVPWRVANEEPATAVQRALAFHVSLRLTFACILGQIPQHWRLVGHSSQCRSRRYCEYDLISGCAGTGT